MLPETNTTITELAQFVSTLVSCLPGLQFGKLHYRNLEIEKNVALRKIRVTMKLSLPSPQVQRINSLGGLKMWIRLLIHDMD